MASLKPSQVLENSIRVINQVFNYSNVPYWLSFGGLFGIVKNNGIIPDGDFDLCTFYGEDYTKVQKAFKGSPGRYGMSKALVSDVDDGKALYCSFGSENGYPHICLSFWYEHDGIMYYCHDQRHEVEGIGIPKSGYFFRGVPKKCVELFMMAEWPGINQMHKIRVPVYSGTMLDYMYPYWPFKVQKYNVDSNHSVDAEKMQSVYQRGASSMYQVHVESMKQWDDRKYIEDQLSQSKKNWDILLKTCK